MTAAHTTATGAVRTTGHLPTTAAGVPHSAEALRLLASTGLQASPEAPAAAEAQFPAEGRHAG